jgi:hypothetical protein
MSPPVPTFLPVGALAAALRIIPARISAALPKGHVATD